MSLLHKRRIQEPEPVRINIRNQEDPTGEFLVTSVVEQGATFPPLVESLMFYGEEGWEIEDEPQEEQPKEPPPPQNPNVHQFLILIEEGDDGSWGATVPDLPLVGVAATSKEALFKILPVVLKEHVARCHENGMRISKPRISSAIFELELERV